MIWRSWCSGHNWGLRAPRSSRGHLWHMEWHRREWRGVVTQTQPALTVTLSKYPKSPYPRGPGPLLRIKDRTSKGITKPISAAAPAPPYHTYYSVCFSDDGDDDDDEEVPRPRLTNQHLHIHICIMYRWWEANGSTAGERRGSSQPCSQSVSRGGGPATASSSSSSYQQPYARGMALLGGPLHC